MSPRLESMLMNEVAPRLRKAVPTIPKTGCEDDEEIVQDCTLQAARMMESAEEAGQPFTAGTMAQFATRAARSGRRSGYAGRSDAMSPGCLLDGNARHDSLDLEVSLESGESFVLHEIVPASGYQGNESDPAEEAARNLDWEAFLASHPPRYRAAIMILAEGGTMRDAGLACGVKDAAAFNLRKKIGQDLIEFFGADVIRELMGGVQPGWASDLRLARERYHTGGHEGAFRPHPQTAW